MTTSLILAGAVVLAFLCVLAWLTKRDHEQLNEVIAGGPVTPILPRWHRPTAATSPAAVRRYAYEVPRPAGARETWTRYTADAPPVATGRPAAAPAQIESWQPARDPNLESDVAVPLAQSIITAALGALVAGVAAWVLELGDPLKVAALAGVGVLALTWLQRLNVFTGLLQSGERVTGRDLDGDGVIGPPERTPHGVLLDPDKAAATVARERAGRERVEAGDALLAFWQACANLGTSEAAHGAKPNTAARAQYVAQRDALLRLGLATWRNPDKPTAGWQLTTDAATAAAVIAAHVAEI